MIGNRRTWLGLAIIVAFAFFGVVSFKKSLTPYVSFSEARASGRMVQVKGFPDHEGARFDQEAAAFRFTMRDETGSHLDVVYRGPKPGNFDQAESVVAIGQFNGNSLECTQLLVKCPSKYESKYPAATESPGRIPPGRGVRLQGGSTDTGSASGNPDSVFQGR